MTITPKLFDPSRSGFLSLVVTGKLDIPKMAKLLKKKLRLD